VGNNNGYKQVVKLNF